MTWPRRFSAAAATCILVTTQEHKIDSGNMYSGFASLDEMSACSELVAQRSQLHWWFFGTWHWSQVVALTSTSSSGWVMIPPLPFLEQ
jgi:hypothetical protein